MNKTIPSSPEFIEQTSAQAGIMAAHAVNAAYDPTSPLFSEENKQFWQLQEAAGLLIGEGTPGDDYLTRNLKTTSDPVELINANWYDVSPRDFGLLPRKQKQEFDAIRDTIREAVTKMDEKFGTGHNPRRNYAVLQVMSKLVIADASDTGVALYGNAQRSWGVDISDETAEEYTITINDVAYDTRKGMTRGVYAAIKASRQDLKNFETKTTYDYHLSMDAGSSHEVFIKPAVTVITGERTARGGYYVANKHVETAVSPQQVLKRRAIRLSSVNEHFDLNFRPAVVLDYPKI